MCVDAKQLTKSLNLIFMSMFLAWQLRLANMKVLPSADKACW